MVCAITSYATSTPSAVPCFSLIFLDYALIEAIKAFHLLGYDGCNGIVLLGGRARSLSSLDHAL